MAIKSSRAASATTKYISTQGGTASYATAAQLPFSGNNVGDRAVLTDTNKLYLWNGNGWFEMVTATSDLTITQHPEASYTLAQDGSSTEITLEATGTGTIEWGYYFNRPVNDAVTVTNVGNVFTITPSTDFNKNGAYKITFYAKNATNVANVQTVVTVNNPPVGQVEFVTPGSYSWTAPAGVTSVSAVAVGGGGAGQYYSADATGGGGGALRWTNNIPVVPGQTYTVVVGAGGASKTVNDSTASNNGETSYFIDTTILRAGGGYGGKYKTIGSGGSGTGDGGGSGGSSGATSQTGVADVSTGGGSAGGYTGQGAQGGSSGNNGSSRTSGSGAGGAGKGTGIYYAYGGGGTGIWGLGDSGVGDSNGGAGGSGGDTATGKNGAWPGGGGGGSSRTSSGSGAGGAVRIIWGPNRAFPSTNTADM